MIREPVARRYAHALFDAAWAEGEAQAPRDADAAARRAAGLHRAGEVGANLQAVDAFLDDPAQEGWRKLLLAPQISRDERTGVIERLFADRAHPLVLRLLHLMLRKQRIRDVASVGEAYRELLDEARGVVRAEVTTAVPLTPDLLETLRRTLRRRLRRELTPGAASRATEITDVVLDTRIDPHLLGGVRVRIGDRVIEHSVRRTLEDMAEALLASPLSD
jgi:F-type H+-transporting ATPase subunit delta